jgi:hypothetical protein
VPDATDIAAEGSGFTPAKRCSLLVRPSRTNILYQGPSAYHARPVAYVPTGGRGPVGAPAPFSRGSQEAASIVVRRLVSKSQIRLKTSQQQVHRTQLASQENSHSVRGPSRIRNHRYNGRRSSLPSDGSSGRRGPTFRLRGNVSLARSPPAQLFGLSINVAE